MVSAATLFHRPEHAHVDLSDLAETADFLDRTYGCACASELGGGEGGRAGALRWRLVTTAGLEWEQIINHEEVGALTASAVVDAPGALRRLPIALF